MDISEAKTRGWPRCLKAAWVLALTLVLISFCPGNKALAKRLVVRGFEPAAIKTLPAEITFKLMLSTFDTPTMTLSRVSAGLCVIRINGQVRSQLPVTNGMLTATVPTSTASNWTITVPSLAIHNFRVSVSNGVLFIRDQSDNSSVVYFRNNDGSWSWEYFRDSLYICNQSEPGGPIMGRTCTSLLATASAGGLEKALPLVGHWEFENDLTDSSGYGKDGTWGGAGAAAYGAGKYGQAVQFDGVTVADITGVVDESGANYVEVSDAYDHNNWTVMVWYKDTWTVDPECPATPGDCKRFESVVTTDFGGVLLERAGDPDVNQFRWLMGAVKLGQGSVAPGAFAADPSPGIGEDPNAAWRVMDNDWHHLAASYDETNDLLNTYLDSAQIGTDATPRTTYGGARPTVTLTGKTTFGCRLDPNSGDAPSRYLGGWVDDVRIYNRVLTQAEIATAMAGGDVIDATGGGGTGLPSGGTQDTFGGGGTILPAPPPGEVSQQFGSFIAGGGAGNLNRVWGYSMPNSNSTASLASLSKAVPGLVFEWSYPNGNQQRWFLPPGGSGVLSNGIQWAAALGSNASVPNISLNLTLPATFLASLGNGTHTLAYWLVAPGPTRSNVRLERVTISD